MIPKPELRKVADVFSSSLIEELANDDFKKMLQLKALLGFDGSEKIEVRHLLQYAFNHLTKYYKSEYVYKCILFKKVILGVHSPNTAAMLSELRLGSSKVDAFIVNGIATSYEIKSEYDNLDRLEKQLSDYAAFSDKVYVLGDIKKIDQLVSNIPSQFGIKVLTKRGTMSTVRTSSNFYPEFSVEKVASLLTAPELKDIVRPCLTSIDDVPNTMVYKACKEVLTTFSAHELKRLTLSRLKCRGIENNRLLAKLPYELVGRVSHAKLSVKKQNKFLNALTATV
ncbi:sce7726 family protein [Salinimonas sp. HHU 13199]|uniref:Sce7726 family protein n=1 Tax=Salinimonas profundi TaxID=2729140 RepID=A0ABR8LQP1_9ALTE|nr:sce7726 family protein [Salinimonas profundi]MBD3587610.1 sce7726 family protein [Salinimonas profundi]